MRATRLQELRDIANAEPDNLDAWLELGKYATDRFWVGISEEAIGKVLREKPDNPQALNMLGKILNRRRNLTGAERVYKRALELSPNEPEILTGLAVVYSNNGNYEQAVEWFEKALEIHPGYPWAVHSLRHSFESLGRYDDIEPLLTKALKANPNSPLINMNYGAYLKESSRGGFEEFFERGLKHLEAADAEEQCRTLRMIGDVSKSAALEYGERLHEKDPDNLDIIIVYAMRLADKDPVKAKMLMKEAIAKDPENIRLIVSLIPIALKTMDLGLVMELKTKMESIKPEGGVSELVDMATGERDVSGLLSSQEKREKYLNATKAMVERFPGLLAAHIKYIGALSMTGRIEEAREQARKTISNVRIVDAADAARFSDLLKLIGMLAEAEEVRSKCSELAASDIEKLSLDLLDAVNAENYQRIAEETGKYIDNHESSPQLLAILGRAQHYIGHPDAKEHLQLAVESGVHDSTILLASLLKRENENEQATDLLKRVIASDTVAELDKGRAYLGLGNAEAAEKLLERFLEENPLDDLGWNIRLLNARNGGETAVSRVAKMKFDAMGIKLKEEPLDDAKKIIAAQEYVKDCMNKVSAGVLIGDVKKQLLRRQIASLLEREREERDG